MARDNKLEINTRARLIARLSSYLKIPCNSWTRVNVAVRNNNDPQLPCGCEVVHSTARVIQNAIRIWYTEHFPLQNC